jgi:hypothetical protein
MMHGKRGVCQSRFVDPGCPGVKKNWRRGWDSPAVPGGEFRHQFLSRLLFPDLGVRRRGGVLVLLIWVNYSALFFLFGAELSCIVASR